MPFGLCSPVCSFQRAMDLVLNGLNLETLLCYLDDIVVFSKTPEEHLERLECLLQRLKDANLKLKPSKCQLFQRRVSFWCMLWVPKEFKRIRRRSALLTNGPHPELSRKCEACLA